MPWITYALHTVYTFRNQYWLWCPIIGPIVGALGMFRPVFVSVTLLIYKCFAQSASSCRIFSSSLVPRVYSTGRELMSPSRSTSQSPLTYDFSTRDAKARAHHARAKAAERGRPIAGIENV